MSPYLHGIACLNYTCIGAEILYPTLKLEDSGDDVPETPEEGTRHKVGPSVCNTSCPPQPAARDIRYRDPGRRVNAGAKTVGLRHSPQRASPSHAAPGCAGYKCQPQKAGDARRKAKWRPQFRAPDP